MAVGELVVNIIGDMTQLSKTFQQVQKDVGTVGKSLQDTGKSLSDVGSAMTTGITAPILAVTAGFGVVAKEAATFEKGMAQVFTLIPNMSKEGMDSMTEDVLNFSKEMGVTTDEVIPALYDAIGSGVPEENVFSFLEVAQKGSVAAATDLGTAVNGLTSIINAYGAENLDAAKASDVLFTGINVGKMTYEELSKSLYEVIPTAASLGVSLEDVTAALATMTAQGTPTSVATSQLRQLFVELSKEGTVASDTFKELSGKSFYEFIQSGGTVQEAIQILSDGMTQAVPDAKELQDAMFELAEPTSGLAQEFEALTGKSFKEFQKEGGTAEEALDLLGVTFGDTKERVSDYFGSVEAGNAILSLTGQGSEIFNNALVEIGNSAGATEKAYQTMADTTAKSTDELKASFQLMAVEIGSQVLPILNDTLVPLFQDTIVPAMEKLIPVIGDILNAFNELPQPIKVGVLAFVALLAALGPIIIVIGSVVSAVGTIAAAFGTGGVFAGAVAWVSATLLPALGTALGAILSPIGLIVAAVAVLYLAWRNNWFGIRDIANTVWEGLETAFNNLVTGLSNAYDQIPARITILRGQISAAWNSILVLYDTVRLALITTATNIYNGLVTAYNNIIISINNLRTQFSTAWTTISTLYDTIRTAIITTSTNLYTGLVTAYNNIVAAITTFLSNWRTRLTDIWNAAVTYANNIINTLQGFYNNANNRFNQIVAAITYFLNNWRARLTDIWNAAVTYANNIISTLTTFYNNAVSIFNSIVTAITTFLSNWRARLTDIWNAAVTYANNIINTLQGFYNNANNIFNQIVAAITAFLGTWRARLTDLWNAAVTYANNIINTLQGFYNNANNIFNQIVAAITAFLSTWRARLTDLWNAAVTYTNYIISTLISWYNRAVDVFNDIIDAILDMLADWRQNWDNMVSAVEDKADDVINAVTGIKDDIVGLVDDFYNAGAAIIDAINDGVNDKIQGVKDSINGLLTWIDDNMPHSPADEGPLSRLPNFSGYISTPLSNAIQSASTQAKSAGSSIISSFTAGVKSAASSMYKAASNAFSKVKKLLPHSPAEEGPFSTLPNWDAVFVDPLKKSINEVSKLSIPLSNALSDIRSPIDSRISAGLGTISNVSNNASYSYGGDTLHIENVSISNGMDLQAIFTQFEQFTANKRRARGYI